MANEKNDPEINWQSPPFAGTEASPITRTASTPKPGSTAVYSIKPDREAYNEGYSEAFACTKDLPASGSWKDFVVKKAITSFRLITSTLLMAVLLIAQNRFDAGQHQLACMAIEGTVLGFSVATLILNYLNRDTEGYRG